MQQLNNGSTNHANHAFAAQALESLNKALIAPCPESKSVYGYYGLPAHAVICHSNETYCDNSGTGFRFTVWDGETAVKHFLWDGYAPHVERPETNANAAQIAACLDYIEQNERPRYLGNGALGHFYKVKNSRKVKKDTVVELINITAAYYDNYYMRRVSEQAVVRTPEGEIKEISLNCLNEWVKGVREF